MDRKSWLAIHSSAIITCTGTSEGKMPFGGSDRFSGVSAEIIRTGILIMRALSFVVIRLAVSVSSVQWVYVWR